jgi:vacuolar-type H+-ATPase subunit D/Vma8
MGDVVSVFSVKIRRDLKEKMERYSDKVNWAEEVRRFIEEKIRLLEAEENYRAILSELEKVSWSVSKGFSTESVREDRDSG